MMFISMDADGNLILPEAFMAALDLTEGCTLSAEVVEGKLVLTPDATGATAPLAERNVP